MESKIAVERNIVFGKTDKEYLTADIYKPIKGEKLPVILLIHGGGFESGSKEKYDEWGPYLARKGFVAMSINYRLATPLYSSWPGVIDDVWAAVNWLVKHANELRIEPLKMALIGDSAGAYIASLFTLMNPVNASFKVRVVVCVYGIYDLDKSSQELNHDLNRLNKKLIGSSYEETPEKYKAASPSSYIKHAIKNPAFNTAFLIIWGEKDELVPPSQSKKFAYKLEKASVEIETLSIPDQGHLWFNITAGLAGGTLQDYPNTKVAPKILAYLEDKLLIDQVGNNSRALIESIEKYQ